jgi:hypothetical protein
MTTEHRHRCHPPRRAVRGTVYACWCRRRWLAFDSVTIRDGNVCALTPDWRAVPGALEL